MRARLRTCRLVPPAGPKYDLFEVGVLILFGGLFVYVFQTADSAASATLTLPGQRVGGIMLALMAATGAALSYRDRTVPASAWVLGLTALFWALVLTIGLLGDPRWGSAFVMILYYFLAQYVRKTWGRYVMEREYAERCTRG